MKKIKVYFFTQISETSFLAKKLKIKTASELILAQNYKHFDRSNIIVNQPDISFEIEFLEAANTADNKNRLLSSLLKISEYDLILIVHANFIAAGIESLQSWRTEYLKFLRLETSTGIWTIASNGFDRADGKSTHSFITTLLDVGLESEFNTFHIFTSFPRYFNKLTFADGQVTKSSTWKKKAYSEINFLKNVPPALSSYFLKIQSLEETNDSVSYRTKSVPCFDLARLTVQNTLDSNEWSFFYSELDSYFNKTPKVEVGNSAYRVSLKSLFIDKLFERIELLKKSDRFTHLSLRFETATGKVFENELEKLVEALSKNIMQSTETTLHFSHGDLCFSNILYDIETKKMILIDPRGIESKSDQFMPQLYDLAKLSQCALGLYDFTIFKLPVPAQYRIVLENSFRNYSKDIVSYPLLRQCEASLFWSLLPLHLDNEENVFRFMLSGHQSLLASLACQ